MMTQFTRLIFYTLPFINSLLAYEYNLTRGRQQWAGLYNAVHYVDHFTFLSNKTPGKHGIFATYFPLGASDEWRFQYELNLKGNITTQ